jgi:hypothetical protein
LVPGTAPLHRERAVHRRERLSVNDYIGQYGLYPCTSASARLPTPKHVPAFVAAIDATADGLLAWSDSTGITAAPQT